MKLLCLLFVSLFSGYQGDAYFDYKIQKFPEVFQFGVSTSAYAIEGGWNEGGKGESIWDRYVHTNPKEIRDRTNGDKAADSYHNAKRDVEMLRELGVDFYRFSISWSRILPNGLISNINKDGIRYYETLLHDLNNYGIRAMVIMYYDDLPQYLQDLGGWANPESVNWFTDYARLLIYEFGHRVSQWITINNPASCFDGYGGKKLPPAINARGVGDYLCTKNMLLAHAKAYRTYEVFRKENKPHGMMGIGLTMNWIDAMKVNSTEDQAVAEVYRQFSIDLFLHPIFSPDGDFPLTVKNIVKKNSEDQLLRRSRLPKLTKEEIKLIKKTADFVGLNHYTTSTVGPKGDRSLPYPFVDLNISMAQSSQWSVSKARWLRSAPFGLYKVCLYLNKQFNHPPIIITEHGWATDTGLMDMDRVNNTRDYLKAMLYAMHDGSDIRGYSTWSLMDSFEGAGGHGHRFGLYEVDFNSPSRKRTPRASALFYRHIIEARIIDYGWVPPKKLEIQVSDRRLSKKTTVKEI